MNHTKKIFVWVCAIIVVVYTGLALLTGADIQRLENRGTYERFTMFIGASAFLVIFGYFVVRGAHLNQPPGGRELFMALYMALLYSCVIVGLPWLFS